MSMINNSLDQYRPSLLGGHIDTSVVREGALLLQKKPQVCISSQLLAIRDAAQRVLGFIKIKRNRVLYVGILTTTKK